MGNNFEICKFVNFYVAICWKPLIVMLIYANICCDQVKIMVTFADRIYVEYIKICVDSWHESHADKC